MVSGVERTYLKLTKFLASGSAVAVAVTMGTAVVPANAAKGNRPLSKVITDGKYDKNGKDFDILAALTKATLDFNPSSPVKVITNGKARLTVFAPDDNAFKNFARTITGRSRISEKQAVDAILATVSPDPAKDKGDEPATTPSEPRGPAPILSDLEGLLLGHMVDGTVTAEKLLKPKYRTVKTKVETKITVLVKNRKSKSPEISLRHGLPSFKDPKVIKTDINKGNKQIAHSISQVYLPRNTFA